MMSLTSTGGSRTVPSALSQLRCQVCEIDGGRRIRCFPLSWLPVGLMKSALPDQESSRRCPINSFTNHCCPKEQRVADRSPPVTGKEITFPDSVETVWQSKLF